MSLTLEAPDKLSCRICKRQFARYTCPTCNIPYCSLTCFRSESHAQCSETFYRKEIESDIHAQSSKAEERLKMMSLLKKFEEESTQADAELDLESDDEEDEDAAELQRRLSNVDLDAASPDVLWAKLTPEERAKFLKIFDNPTSDLAQQLLASDELERQRQSPWWEASAPEDIEQPGPGAQPAMMHIPPSLVRPLPGGHFLGYNICAVCIAYAYVTRYLSTSPLSVLTPDEPEYDEAKATIAKLVPFLTDRKSTTVYPNLSSVVTDLWSRIDTGKVTSDLFSLLLRDTAHLLRPLPVLVVPASASASAYDSHPHRTAILVLSDLSRLWKPGPLHQPESNGPSQPSKPGQNHITQKCLFYAAHMLSMPTALLKDLTNEVLSRSKTLETARADTASGDPLDITESGRRPGVSRPRTAIEEI